MTSEGYTHVEDDLHEDFEASQNPDRCDDTVPITEDSIQGSAVPIAFRDIFFDDRLRPSQRHFCLGSLALLCFIVVVLFITLVACFSRVVGRLNLEQNANAYQGLRMVPEFDTRTSNAVMSLARDKVTKGRYVEKIQEYLEAYKKEQSSRANFTTDCKPTEKPSHAWCRFPVETFDVSSCTATNRYGYDVGEPCFLFELRLKSGWAPSFTRNVDFLPLKCEAYDQLSMRLVPGVQIISALGNGIQGSGFPINKIPSRAISDADGRDVSDENGETLYDQPGLVFVKLRLGKTVHTTMRCYLPTQTPETTVLNLASLPGRRAVVFDIFYPYAQ